MSSVVAIVLFLLFLVIGAPIAVALGLASAVAIFLSGLPLGVVAQRAVNGIDSLPLLAVPLFIFAASLFTAIGLTDRIFNFVRLLSGWARGGLAQVNIVASLIFSGISGAALADIGGTGRVQMRLMLKQGYTPEFSAGVTIASATIGPIFPPSIPLIIFAAAAEISAVKLLVAGVIPALLITLFLMIQVAIIARRQDMPRDRMQVTLRDVAGIVADAIPALLAPVILLGGLLTGWFGPTEVAAVTVAYALLLGALYYRNLTWQVLIAASRDTVRSTASILFIVANAALFAWILTIDQIPNRATEFLLGLSTNGVVLLLLVNVLLLLVGMFLESIAAILILAPILVPALSLAGVDPVHLGVVVVLNLMIGLMTPPVGMSLYMMSTISRLPVERVFRGTLPFFIPLLLSLLILTLFPAITTWLPNLLFN